MQLNNQGCVCDIVKSFQLEPGESQDLCGPWATAALKYAGLPGKGATGTPEDIDVFADSEADKWLAGGHTGATGSTIENMHAFLHDAGNLHYWDLTSPTVDNIRLAVQAGYVVLFTANEQNIIEKKTGARAYPWNLDANHILPTGGIDPQGDFICPDQLNNEYQGYWPPVYLASKLAPIWATVVQLVGPDPANPWLKPIPSGDPASWPQGFDAQNFGGPPPVDEKLAAFQAEWGSNGTYDPNTGIAQLAYADYQTPNFHGCPVAQEVTMPDGTSLQRVNRGVWIWNHTTHTGAYHPYYD